MRKKERTELTEVEKKMFCLKKKLYSFFTIIGGEDTPKHLHSSTPKILVLIKVN